MRPREARPRPRWMRLPLLRSWLILTLAFHHRGQSYDNGDFTTEEIEAHRGTAGRSPFFCVVSVGYRDARAGAEVSCSGFSLSWCLGVLVFWCFHSLELHAPTLRAFVLSLARDSTSRVEKFDIRSLSLCAPLFPLWQKLPCARRTATLCVLRPWLTALGPGGLGEGPRQSPLLRAPPFLCGN